MPLTNHASGHLAEQYAAQYLVKQGFHIVQRNWRTRLCEIDIVATKAASVYFVEVKHRRTAYQGTGMQYITPAKLHRMQFAAELWVQRNNWQGAYRLAVVELSGPSYRVTAFIDEL